MAERRRQLKLTCAICLFVLVFGGCVRPSFEPVDKEAAQDLLDSRCRRCHSLSRVYRHNYDRTEWSKVIDVMHTGGARLDERERDVMSAYLAFGRR